MFLVNFTFQGLNAKSIMRLAKINLKLEVPAFPKIGNNCFAWEAPN
jgi:hypothetical protein